MAWLLVAALGVMSGNGKFDVTLVGFVLYGAIVWGLIGAVYGLQRLWRRLSKRERRT